MYTLLSPASYFLWSRISIITLEDVLEALVQEQIYDESDKAEGETNHPVVQWTPRTWRSHMHRKKQARSATGSEGTEGGGGPSLLRRHLSMGAVPVDDHARMEAHIHRKKHARAATTGDGTEGGGGPSLLRRHFSMGAVPVDDHARMEAHETSRLLPDESTSGATGDIHHPAHPPHHQSRRGLLQFWNGLSNRG